MTDRWTDEQKQVIRSRQQNLLVAAAAGSGKTAVLVERILGRILDRDNPLSLDRILVVTFTNAAAAQLRERIREAVTQALEKDPENPAAIRQMALLHNDHIQTIDSFCLDLIRDHYSEIGLDPAFRIGDEGELKLMRSEAAGLVLEELYESADEDFLEFSRCYAAGKDDRKLESFIEEFYIFSMAHPFPALWRKSCALAYREMQTEEGEAGRSAEAPGEGEAGSSAETPGEGEADRSAGASGERKDDSSAEASWMELLLDYAGMRLADMEDLIQQLLRISRGEGGPSVYIPALESDLDLLGRLRTCGSYAGFQRCFAGLKWKTLSGKKDPAADPQLREYVKDLRNKVKEAVVKIGKEYFSLPPELEEEFRLGAGRFMDVLVRMTDLFELRFHQAKEEKNILDFSDVEHAAVRVLLKTGEDGSPLPSGDGFFLLTPAAREYREYFQEVYIDEYQDSNPVQELLLRSVSREDPREGGRFMVGDVKQSIYRFRMAEPGIFMEKYDSYPEDEDGPCRRIDLHKNFRSRAGVLDSVNLVFRQIMRKEIGGISYGPAEALEAGKTFPALPEGTELSDFEAELILVDPAEQISGPQEAESGAGTRETRFGSDADGKASASGDRGADSEDRSPAGQEAGPDSTASGESSSGAGRLPDTEEKDRKELEAAVTAQRIRQIAGKLPVWDEGLNAYRPARYGDIVILLRTAGSWARTFSEVLTKNGIPNRSGSRTGYFSAEEVRTVLSCLRILDNPRQDIPLAAVLRSPVGGLTDDELAMLRIVFPKEPLYDCVNCWLSGYADRPDARFPEGDQKRLTDKLARFSAVFSSLRERVCDLPIHLLLWKILDETGYGDAAAAGPDGLQKKANLDMLVEKAIAYEKTSYKGLFHFIRYIEKLKKFEVDFGEAGIAQEDENLVRIMTIHRSKGLEFPIVFVSGLGAGINRMDTRGPLLLHASLGAGINFIDPGLRLEKPVLMKKVIAAKIDLDNLGEELRILYVAMTRAKEKLILTGCVRDRAAFAKKLGTARRQETEKLSFSMIQGAGSMLEWVFAALLRHKREQGFLEEAFPGLPGLTEENPVFELPGGFRIRTGAEILRGALEREQEAEQDRVRLGIFDPGTVYDPRVKKELETALSSAYRYPGHGSIPGKVSVSELKMIGYEAEMERRELEEEAAPLGEISASPGRREDPPADYPVPEFMKEEPETETVSGAVTGTLYHMFLADFDFRLGREEDAVARQLETMVRCDKIQKDEAALIRPYPLKRFLQSDLARRMGLAQEKGMLYREMPFVTGMKADRLKDSWDPGETVLVQGIIDAYFFEEDGIVLVDYKTDRALEGDEESLVRRYQTQFDLYREALESLTGKRVKESFLYSLSLGRAVPVPAREEKQEKTD